MVPVREVQTLALAAAFCVPATLPFFTSDRASGLRLVAVGLALVIVGSIAGGSLLESVDVRRAIAVRNVQTAFAGAVCASLLSGILWARDVVRESRGA